jgi:predicted nucleic acid-binding protein
VAARLLPLLVGGGAATCALVDLEVLASLPDPQERAAARLERRQFPRVQIDEAVLERALDVQERLDGPPVAPSSLVVAAAAERAGLVLLHHDDTFERIAAVTGQPTEWVDADDRSRGAQGGSSSVTV